MNFLTRVKSWWGGDRTAWGTSELGNWFPINTAHDMSTVFQRNISPANGAGIAALQGAIGAHVAAFTLMPVEHKWKLQGGGFETLESGAVVRWFYKPNAFQTFGEFMASGIRQLLETGNAVAVASRNDRYEVVSTIWASSHSVYVDPEDGDIFYMVNLSDGRGAPEYMVPARDVMHLKINAPIHSPLRGRSPIQYCAASLAANSQLLAFLNSYMSNRASPSYALTTDASLTRENMASLRAAWADQSKQIASGGTPILSNGLKPVPLGVAPGDDLLVSTFNMTVEDVARAFNMPRALLGISETAANAEQLMRSWMSLGLGSLVELVEQSIEKLFELPRNEHVEFDHNAMLRLDTEAQMRVIAEAVVKGVISADEGRAQLGLAPIKGGFGAVPSAQQQQVPLDLLHQLHSAEINAKLRADTPAPVAAPTQQEPPASEAEKEFDPATVKDLSFARLQRKRIAA